MSVNLKVVIGDITTSPNEGIIIHQVNCQGVMGSGVAKALTDTFPDLKQHYLDYCKGKTPQQLLGTTMLVSCVNKYTGLTHWIANVFGQLEYGRDTNKVYTDYNALATGLKTLEEFVLQESGSSEPLYHIPYGIGAGLANGDWKTIVGIIKSTLSGDVILYKLQDRPIRFGFTEGCDPSVSYLWYDNLSNDGNVVISKNLTDELKNYLIHDSHRIIFHHTVTGFGGFPIERKVPTKEWSRSQFDKLIADGFPVEQVVLRIDPIIPTDKGIMTALSVMELYRDSGIKRVRFSFLDMYNHVKDRFIANNIPLPYDTFHAPNEMMLSAINKLTQKADEYGFVLEACAEQILHKKGCLSETDYDILNIPYEESGSNNQRKTCSCKGAKYELFPRGTKCTMGCLYCYWR